MEREVRYCTSEDGVRVAYCVEGEGTPLIALPAFIESFSLLHLFPKEEAFWRRVTERHRLIRLDWRGTGLSQREIDHSSLDKLCLDIDAVVTALELDRFAVWASGTGAPWDCDSLAPAPMSQGSSPTERI